MDGGVESFVSITGSTVETAIYFLEMSGYDLETSLQLFFEGGISSNSASNNQENNQEISRGGRQEDNNNNNNNIKYLFSSDKSLPESWLLQGLQFDYTSNNSNNKWSGIGIKQHKNGPCGVLIAFQATVVANLIEQGRLTENIKPNDEDVIQALVDILLLCKGDKEQVTICTWSDPVNGIGKGLETIEISTNDGVDSVSMVIYSVLQQFYSPGGVILLALSAIATITPEKIRQFNTELPLSFGTFHICSSALVQLLLNGQPDDNISAYSPTGEKRSLIKKSKVGLLSGMEIEQKFLVRDELKFPTQEVYVLHGRDHFTLGFITNVSDDNQNLQMIHWNGLPPAGPRITILNIKLIEGIRSIAPETAAEGVGIEYKPIVNTIDSIIQADPNDKALRPKQWNTWTYEVALVIDDPTNQSPERPSHLPQPPTFSLKESDLINRNWRCRSCYETRFQTMCFGMNELGTTSCQYCGSNRSAVGWTLWLSYQELPSSWQRYLDRQHGPQIITVLRTKWPGCEVSVVNENGEHLPNLEYPSV